MAVGAQEGLLAHQRVAPASPATDSASSLDGKKLRKAAMDFESLLINALWQSMQADSLGTGEEKSDPGADTLKQLGVQAMSNALAAAGGLGIGKLLLRQLMPALEPSISSGKPDLSGLANPAVLASYSK